MNLTHKQYQRDILTAAKKVTKKYVNVFGIPRGGNYPAAIVAKKLGIPQVFDPKEIVKGKTLLVDDLVDSGATAKEWKTKTKCDLLVAYSDSLEKAEYVGALKEHGEWVVFPDESGSGIEENIKRILQYIGEDVNREGLLETPKRVRKAYEEVFSGYKMDPKSLVKTFTQGTCKEMVILKNAEYVSFCEHHMFPFFGHCSIGYVPRDKVIGVSKLARLLDCYAKRMQIQERMTSQIADFLEKELDALGVYVVCEGVHFCMKGRGVKKQDSSMVTSAIRGQFMENAAMRQEFLSLIGK